MLVLLQVLELQKSMGLTYLLKESRSGLLLPINLIFVTYFIYGIPFVFFFLGKHVWSCFFVNNMYGLLDQREIG